MRLDLLLVRRGLFSSRQRAKYSIKKGAVIVNGKTIRKPSTQVDPNAKIQILGEERPRGYWKLREIDRSFNLFKGEETVLDLGSSAGGFLLYASERSKFVYGIEYSKNFENSLLSISRRRDNVRVFIDDCFNFNLDVLPKLDLILDDLSLPFSSSFTALKRFLPKLKDDGRILFVHKIGDNQEPFFENLKVLNSLKSKNKKEVYYLLKK